MIKKYNNEFDINKYINGNYNRCLYLYLDFIKYGSDSNKVKIYYQLCDNKITCIMLNYYTALHIYSNSIEDCDFIEIANFINKNEYLGIFGEKELIYNISKYLPKYESEYGFVRKNTYDSNEYDDDVEIATLDDFDEIVDLILLDDDIASSYDKDVLLAQLKERYIDSFGRNYIIRKDGKIVAHICTNGEINEFACLGLVIVHPKYRKNGFAKNIVSKMAYDLLKENKELFLINYTDVSSQLYEKLGFEISCEWGKLNLKR